MVEFIKKNVSGDDMKRLLVLFFVVLLAISVCACKSSTNKSETESNPSAPSGNNAVETSKITEEEAIEIASQHWGIKSGDRDEKTGFTFLIMPVNSASDNIIIDLKWLVNDQNYSTVDSV